MILSSGTLFLALATMRALKVNKNFSKSLISLKSGLKMSSLSFSLFLKNIKTKLRKNEMFLKEYTNGKTYYLEI